MLNKKIGLLALFAGFAASDLMAANTLTNYTTGDVLVCFRNGGANDLVVDAGPVVSLTSAAPNQRIPITQYSSGQLNAAFGGVDGLDWSAFTWLGDNTLYVTQARTVLNTQTSPFQAYNSSVQHNTVLRMATIPPGANFNIAYNGLNTPVAVIEPDSVSTYHTGSSYANAWSGSYGGGFNGTFSTSIGNPENSTPGGFDSSGTVVRSDFYMMIPAGGYTLGTYLGYFEFAPDGTMTYVAYPSAVPVINSISRSNNVSAVSYSTGLYGTYTLRGTNTLSSGVAATNWPAISTLTSGATTSGTYMDTDSSANKFYIITAQ